MLTPVVCQVRDNRQQEIIDPVVGNKTALRLIAQSTDALRSDRSSSILAIR